MSPRGLRAAVPPGPPPANDSAADDHDLIVVSTRRLRAIVADELSKHRNAAPPQPPLPEYLTVEGAAELLSLHPRTVTKMAADGEIPSSRIGRRMRFLRSELAALLEARSQKARR